MQRLTLMAALAMLTATSVAAETWTLDTDLSKISFGSIKENYVGESHGFPEVSGTVNDAGQVAIDIALASVVTNIDIRNERMREMVFNNTPSAKVTAEIDKATLDSLAVGDATTTETTGTLALLGEELELDANFFVMRLSDDRVLVTTDDMVMLSTEDIGIDSGIDQLQEVAGLESITRVSPVTMRLIFNKD